MANNKKLLEIQSYVHPLSVGRAINGATRPWNRGYECIFSASTIAKTGRNYGDICKKFGKNNVNAAMISGIIMISCDAWQLQDGEAWSHGVEFDPSRCNNKTPITANGTNAA